MNPGSQHVMAHKFPLASHCIILAAVIIPATGKKAFRGQTNRAEAQQDFEMIGNSSLKYQALSITGTAMGQRFLCLKILEMALSVYHRNISHTLYQKDSTPVCIVVRYCQCSSNALKVWTGGQGL